MFSKSNSPVTRVELRISCLKLPKKDTSSKSDPCVTLFTETDPGAGSWNEYGRTEIIENCEDPQFVTSFEIDYYFELNQRLKFGVYDIDNKTEKLEDDDFIGQLECSLGQIVSSKTYTRKLTHKGKTLKEGTITVECEEVKGISDTLSLKFHAKNLDNKDTFGKSDPFLLFSRQKTNGEWINAYKTEVVKNSLSPSWRPIMIESRKLFGGNQNSELKIECYDYDSNGSHDLIGSFCTRFSEISKASEGEVSWSCINEKKKSKKESYTDSGTILLTYCKVSKKEKAFYDFITSGLQLNFTVGIDFTASNGEAQKAGSLHYITPEGPNDYQKAISSVGSVIEDYDFDKKFPALGFGARIPPHYSISHEFALNFNAINPFCNGINGILEEYKMCLSHIQFYGPTNFSPIINHVAKFALTAHEEKQAKHYCVLLILTDGAISDMDDTLEALVYASGLPMSVIIVGIGCADFDAMKILDGDNGVLKSSSGKEAFRDIVQFVEFSHFKNSQSDLAKHVLAEVPKQVTDYYKKYNINPLKT